MNIKNIYSPYDGKRFSEKEKMRDKYVETVNNVLTIGTGAI